MSLWMVRAGRHGEYERRYLERHRIYLNWDGLTYNLADIDSMDALQDVLEDFYPDAGRKTLIHHAGQIWTFVKRMKVGDWVVTPSKHKPAIHVAKIIGDYRYDESEGDPWYHYREVEWLQTDIPRSNFDQDLLYSMGAFMAICQISRNNAEQRVNAMANAGWKSTGVPIQASDSQEDEEVAQAEDSASDLEQVARDQIAKLIEARFKGHGMARLVESILEAQGCETFRSPEGADKGVDILAAPGQLGFGQPRICVQVKSGSSPLDRPTMDQLIGAMQNVNAEQGLLVSWGGFKSTVDRERANQFFRVRLWDQDDLIDQILESYDRLSDDIRAELPLKRIWTVARDSEE